MIDAGAKSDVDTIVTSRAPIDLILTIKKMEFDNRKKVLRSLRSRVSPAISMRVTHESTCLVYNPVSHVAIVKEQLCCLTMDYCIRGLLDR